MARYKHQWLVNEIAYAFNYIFEDARFDITVSGNQPSPAPAEAISQKQCSSQNNNNIIINSAVGGGIVALLFIVSKFLRRGGGGSGSRDRQDISKPIIKSRPADVIKDLERSGCQTISSLNLAETFNSQGNTAMQSKLYSDAIELYTYAIALCESNSVYYCSRGVAYTEIYRYARAIRDYKKSIEIDPNYSKAYRCLGFAYYSEGNYRNAIDEGYVKALQLEPDNASLKEKIRVTEQKLRDAQLCQNRRITLNGNDIANILSNVFGQHHQH